MSKYYRVMKETPLWSEGAILKLEEGTEGYVPINDLWNVTDKQTEYLSASIVENSANSEWFQRVYEASAFGKLTYVTKDKARELANKFFNGDAKDETNKK